MQYAINEQGKRVIAYSGGRGVCPVCFSPVLAKVGVINVRHWAHISCDECDNWSEPETLWHRQWKDCVPETWREVVTEKNGKRRRADIMRPDGIAVELQHSSISVEEIVEREAFYGNMTWIFDARTEYLARLILPPKRDTPRRLINPFAGTMSESIGAMLAGWEEITAIELDPEYAELGRERFEWWRAKVLETGLTDPSAILKSCGKQRNPKERAGVEAQTSLFEVAS